MTVTSRVRPAEFEDLSHLDAFGDDADVALPTWIDEIIAAEVPVPAARPVPVELLPVEAIIEVEPPAPEATAEALAAAEERREVSISFELGHRAGFEHGRNDGHAAGYRDGLEAGRLEALEAGHATTRALLGALRTRVAEHDAALGSLADEVAQRATELAFGIAEMVLQRELLTAADPGADAIRRAVAALPHSGPTVGSAVVRLHPDDVARLTADPQDLLVGAELTVAADPAVEPGSCVLDVDSTRVDTTVSSALARVREVLAS